MARSTQVATQVSTQVSTRVSTPELTSSMSFKIAKNISLLGNHHGDNVSSAALRAGLSTSTVYRFMNAGVRAYNPTLRTLTKLAGAFKTPLHDFVNVTKTGRAALISK